MAYEIGNLTFGELKNDAMQFAKDKNHQRFPEEFYGKGINDAQKYLANFLPTSIVEKAQLTRTMDFNCAIHTEGFSILNPEVISGYDFLRPVHLLTNNRYARLVDDPTENATKSPLYGATSEYPTYCIYSKVGVPSIRLFPFNHLRQGWFRYVKIVPLLVEDGDKPLVSAVFQYWMAKYAAYQKMLADNDPNREAMKISVFGYLNNLVNKYGKKHKDVITDFTVKV